MNLLAAAANSAWIGASVPAWLRSRQALDHPDRAQWTVLRRQLAANAQTAYGRAHAFDQISNYREFVRRVPLIGYGELEPWVMRIMSGESGVLTSERVTTQ